MSNLKTENPVDRYLKPVKSGDQLSALEISTEEVKVKKLIIDGETIGATIGYLQRESDGVSIESGNKLYLDGGGDTYIYEASGDSVRIIIGGIALLQLSEGGVSGQRDVLFREAAAGFTKEIATFDATDTEIDFTQGNKQQLTLTADITDVHFKFPNMSGNFLCVFIQDGTGSRDVSNWKTKDSAGNAGAGNSGVVKWAGGSATTLTEAANAVDIVSIYWDSNNEMAYAVASENFS